MKAIEDVNVEITVVLGTSEMPISQLLKMGRGAVIDLEARDDENVMIYANGQLVARGEIVISSDKIAVSISHIYKSFLAP